MKRKGILGLVLAVVCAACLIAGCSATGNNDAKSSQSVSGEHPTITMNAPYSNMSTFYDLVHEKYPEINLEIIPYNGQDYTDYVNDMRKSGQMTDIFFCTYYTPGRSDDASDFLDLSSYSFTDSYAQSRLREVTNDGAVYMLPLGYNALGITYNKTLLEKHGWTLPTNLAELEDLKAKADAAGVIFCRDQLQYPGYGFQYLCNILDTSYLSTLDGMKWQNAFLAGDATLRGSDEMMESMQLLNRWRDLGMLNADGTPDSDSDTKAQMIEGNTLFLIGNSNSLKTQDGATDELGLMPYLSENGDQNVYILNVSRYMGLNKSLGEAGNEQKLEDALHVMEVLSTVEGMESLDPTQNAARLLPLKDAAPGEDSYYADILDDLNNGHTAQFIYSGWENAIVPIGNKMIEFVKGTATLDDVIDTFDGSQSLITENTTKVYTTATETIGMDDCARLVGICFGKATGADAALVSTNPWVYNTDVREMNKDGVSGSLFPVDVTDSQIASIFPTGWKKNIQTVTLTGARIKELAQTGYDHEGDGSLMFPYVLVTKNGVELDDDAIYTIPICGASDEVKAEGGFADSGIMGLTAAEDYLGTFDTLSASDIVWE